MTQLLKDLKEKEDVEKICKDNSLNMALLGKLIKLKFLGLTNTGVAQELGVHRVTIQRYMDTIRKMNKHEAEKIYDYLIKKNNERDI